MDRNLKLVYKPQISGEINC